MNKAIRRDINYEDFEESHPKSKEELFKDSLDELENITKLYSSKLSSFEKDKLKMFELVGSGIQVETESDSYPMRLRQYAFGIPTLANDRDLAYAYMLDTEHSFERYVSEANYLRKISEGNFRNSEEKEKMDMLEGYRRCSSFIRGYIKEILEQSDDKLIPKEIADMINLYNVNKELLVTDTLVFKEDGLYVNRIYDEVNEDENDEIMGLNNALYDEEEIDLNETSEVDTFIPEFDENSSNIDDEIFL